jgi:hypothetical protein
VIALAWSAQTKADSVVSITGGGGGIHGRLHTDGLLTVGQQETITVNKLPGKFRLQAVMSPPPTATDACFQFTKHGIIGFCVPEPLFRVPGAPPFRSSTKGRASLTFTTPPAYEFLNFRDPLQSHPIYLIDGQTVHVDVLTVTKHRNRRGVLIIAEFAVASTIVRVEVPPSSPPPA